MQSKFQVGRQNTREILTGDEVGHGLDPVLDVLGVAILVPDESGFDVLLTGQGTEAHGWEGEGTMFGAEEE